MSSTPSPSPSDQRDAPDSIAALLGGRRAGIDASLPPIVFVAAWLATGRSVGWGALAALVVGAGIAAYRAWRGDRPRAVLLGLLGVAVAALIANYTGRASDFFLPQLATNAASALAWLCSIVLRWPLLGLIVGTLLGQRTAWRRDPALRRAYGWASLVWVFQYVVRLVVFVPLYLADQTLALGVMRGVLTWPLVAVCIVVSGWVFKKTLPSDHPGTRHPRPAH